MARLLEPYPSRDPIVDKDGYAAPDFDKWISQTLSQAVEASPGVTPEYFSDDALNAGIVLTPLIPLATQAVYRLTGVIQIMTPDPVSNSVQVALTYFRNGVTQTETFAAVTGTLTTTHQGFTFPFRCDGGTPISYTVTYASNTPNLCVYSLDLIVELVRTVG